MEHQFYPMKFCWKLIDEIETLKGSKVKTLKTKEEDDDFELQSIWPQLSKVLKWLIVNKVEKAVEVLKLVICGRRIELKRSSPTVNTTEELKRSMRTLMKDGIDADRLKEPEKRKQSIMHREEEDDDMTKDETKDIVDAIVERFLLCDQEDTENDNDLKIEHEKGSQTSTTKCE